MSDILIIVNCCMQISNSGSDGELALVTENINVLLLNISN